MIDLKKYLDKSFGNARLIKLTTGVDVNDRATENAKAMIVIMLDYEPIDLNEHYARLQVRTQVLHRNQPLDPASRHRQDIGEVVVPLRAESLDEWYLLVGEAVIEKLTDNPNPLNTLSTWVNRNKYILKLDLAQS